jgi:hypothetical protein
MSLWLSLEIDTGGPEPVELWSMNMTHNVNPMWRRLFGVSIGTFLDGSVATTYLYGLRCALDYMEANMPEFEALNPPNGWGSAAGTLDFLRGVYLAAQNHPKATWRASQ